MHCIAVINPDDISSLTAESWKNRQAVRVVVVDGHQQAGLLYVGKEDYHKLPGGGIEEDEDTYTAAQRECREELGVDVEILAPLGKIEEFRTAFQLFQVSYCFLARTISEKKDPAFSDTELKLKMQVDWMPIENALKVMKNFANARYSDRYGNKIARERDSICFSAGYEKYKNL